MRFDHIGIPTIQKRSGEKFVPATRVWITEPQKHPFQVEWLRYEPDSPVTGPLRDQPHVGFRVDDVREIAERGRGMKVLLEPFDAGFAVAGFYQTPDGANIEFVWYRHPPE